MHRITGSLKDYDWGIPDGLSIWCGSSDGAPQAELWFGAHPSGPSPLTTGDGTLADAWSSDDVPLLVKLLAAGRPLSIQVHPDAQRAAEGFARQGDERIYSDDHEKTELLVALQEFDAFCGWRDTATAASILEHMPGTNAAVAALRGGDRRAALRALVDMRTSIDIGAWNAELPAAVRAAGLPREDIDAYETVVREFPGDPGVPATVLLDVLSLASGDAVYVPAGIPHSYIRGVGLEVMTSSDNVLRLGLTGKPIHIEEAFTCLDWTSAPTVIRGQSSIAPDRAPFAVDLVHQARADSGHYRVILAIDGSAVVDAPDESIDLVQGQGLAIAADEPAVRVTATGLAAVVRATP